MSRAEEFIKKQSHIIENPTSVWISSYNARKAVDIAREETINDMCDWIASGLDVNADGILTVNVKELVKDLKQAMKDE